MYILITPVKNEEKHLPFVAEQVRAQELQPERWIIIDDGSTDKTPELVADLADRVPWISKFRLERDSSEYDTEFGYATVVATGIEMAREEFSADWMRCDYVGVLDCDILVRRDYFQTLFEELASNSRYGVGSGLLHTIDRRDTTDGNPWGGAMLFDRRCLSAIGGYPISPSPDAVLRIKIEKRGGIAFKTAETSGLQLRPPQSALGLWNGHKQKGAGRYYLNYHPVNALLTGLHYCTNYPFYHGIGYLYGYVLGSRRFNARIPDREVRRHYRDERFTRLKRTLVNRLQRRRSKYATRIRQTIPLFG